MRHARYDNEARYTSTPGSQDNATGNESSDVTGNAEQERLAKVAAAEMGFLTDALQAKRWGLAPRDPGLPHQIEVIVFNDHDGQYTVIKIPRDRAFHLAGEFLRMAERRL